MCTRSCFFVRISTVLLIHEVTFSRCDLLKTNSPNRLVESYIDGYQREARQAPIDPSRMYLPPKIDAVASSGFGGQVDASNNFGDNINGYGEIGLNQNTYGSSSSVDGSDYESSTKAINDLNGAQTSAGSYDISTTSGFEGSSLDQSTGYNVLSSKGNNFDQNFNKNNKYNDQSSPGTSSYGRSLGAKPTPSNNIHTQSKSADSYGQGEILNTAQSQGISQSNYSKLTESSTFSQNTGVSQQYNQGTNKNTANGYSNVDPNTLKTSLQDSSNRNSGQNINDQKNNEKFGSSGNQQYSSNNDNYKNAVANSLNQKPTNDIYNPIRSGDNAGYSYNQPSIGFVDFPTSNINNQNKPSKSTMQINNENYGQYGIPNTQNFQLGEYNQGETSKYEQSFVSNYESGLNSNTQSSQKFNNYGQPETNFSQNRENYGQNNNEYNNQDSSSNLLGRPNQNQGQQKASNNYEQSGTQSHINGDSFIQSLSNSPVNGDQSKPYNSFGQNQLGTQQIPNNYGQTGSQPSPSNAGYYGQSGSIPSISDGYSRGSSSNSGSLQSYGTNNVREQNSLNRANPISNQLGDNRDIPTSLPERNRYAQTHETQNNLMRITGRQSSGQGSSGWSSNYGRRRIGSCALLCNKIMGRNSLSSSANTDSGNRSQKKVHSILVPKGQYQNSNLPSRGDFEKLGKDPQNNGNYGEPGSNAFSNFAPGSPPNQPEVNNDQPGTNAFSNFAPGNLPNQPEVNNDQPGANAFSNFAPGNLPNQPEVNNDQPGANAFSNFAPGNLPNQPEVNNELPGANAFSNFAPGSLPNQPEVNNDQPGVNVFSNFAPGNLPNQPEVNNELPSYNSFSNFAPHNLPNQPPANDDQPGANAFSNFAPGNLHNQPEVNNDQPGANAFSNFAPGNLPNQPEVNNDQPGANAFSNFAPGNQPNQPPPANSINSNECGNSSTL